MRAMRGASGPPPQAGFPFMREERFSKAFHGQLDTVMDELCLNRRRGVPNVEDGELTLYPQRSFGSL